MYKQVKQILAKKINKKYFKRYWLLFKSMVSLKYKASLKFAYNLIFLVVQ